MYINGHDCTVASKMPPNNLAKPSPDVQEQAESCGDSSLRVSSLIFASIIAPHVSVMCICACARTSCTAAPPAPPADRPRAQAGLAPDRNQPAHAQIFIVLGAGRGFICIL